MDDQRAGLRAARDKALEDRQRLDIVIGYLSEQLGEPVPDGPGPGVPAGGFQSGAASGADPVAGTNEAEYYGYPSTKAAYAVLQKFGNRQRPLKTKVIFEAVNKGGVKVSTEGALYRSLSRSHRFRKVGPNLWGLSAWYPATTKRDRDADMSNVHDLQDADDESQLSDDEESTEVDTA